MNRLLVMRAVALSLGASSLAAAGMAVWSAAQTEAGRRPICFHVQIADGHAAKQEFVVVAFDRDQALSIVRPFRRPAAENVPVVATALHQCDIGFLAGVDRIYARSLDVRPLPSPSHTAAVARR